MPSPSQSLKPVAWRISSDRNSIASVTDSKARADSLRKYPHAVIEPLVRLSDVEALSRPTPPEAQAGAGMEERTREVLRELLSAYEAKYPPASAGVQAQDDWCTRQSKARIEAQRVLSTAAPKAVAHRWRPIETAPKDEILMLATEFDRPGDWRIKCGYYSVEMGLWRVWGASWTPTMWQPLPSAPSEEKKA